MTAPRSAHVTALAAISLWLPIELLGARIGARHTAFQTVWLRYAAHLALLLGFCALRGRMHELRTRQPLLQLLRGLMMFIMPVAFITAAGEAGADNTWTIFWIAPLLVLAAAPLAGESPRPAHWFAAAIGWVGAVLVLGGTVTGMSALVSALAMAGSFAGYLLLSRVLREEPLMASLFFTGLGAIAPMTLFALPAWTPLTPADALPVFAIGVASLLFLASVDRAVETAPAVTIAPVFTGVVIVEALLRRWTGHSIGSVEAVGLMMILTSLVLLLPARRSAKILVQDS